MSSRKRENLFSQLRPEELEELEEQESEDAGTFQRATKDEIASRRILKVRRNTEPTKSISSDTEGNIVKSNPFAQFNNILVASTPAVEVSVNSSSTANVNPFASFTGLVPSSTTHIYEGLVHGNAAVTTSVAELAHAMVDIVQRSSVDQDGNAKYEFLENQDLRGLLASHKKAILFAVPGAFTPTCSGKHLPGFIEKMDSLKEKGVEAVYCLSVNDRFVMKAWAEHTQGCVESGILMVADGNGDFTRAMEMSLDRTANRMGIRSKRYAMVLEEGKVKELLVDESGLEKSSVEHVLTVISSKNA